MKSKRFLAFVLSIFGNFFMAYIGIMAEVDLSALGIMLAMLNGPLYVYIAGDTARPSGKQNNFNK